MSVYKKENYEYLKTALDSVINQSLQPTEVVLVQDGRLTKELYKVIEEYQINYPKIFKTYVLNENQGLGKALNFGLERCKYEIVARMDTDDIALPYRFELQIKEFEKDKELVLLGGQIAEFENAPEEITSYRKVPIEAINIDKFIKKRNPFNHMTVVFKKSLVQSVGGYKDMPYFEDYWLWARIIKARYKSRNIDKVLVYVRAGKEMIARRGGIKYAMHIFRFEKALLNLKILNGFEFLWITVIRCFVALLPCSFREQLYKYCLRK